MSSTQTVAGGVDRPRRGRARRVILWTLGAVVVVIVAALIFAPSIAARLAPGIIESAANPKIAGTIKVDRVGLSWGGPQRIGPITLSDPEGKVVGTFELNATTPIMGVARGSLALGTITLSGGADLVRFADGSTNLQKAIAPRAGASPAPAPPPSGGGGPQSGQVPNNLEATLVLDSLKITLTDLAAPGAPVTAAITDLDGEVSIASGAPIKATLAAVAEHVLGGGSKPGALTLDATIDKIFGADGSINPDAATVQARLDAKDLPVGLIDALAGLSGKLSGALGDSLNALVTADGDMNAAVVSIQATGSRAGVALVTAAGALEVKDKHISTTSPVEITIVGSSIEALAPGLLDSLAESGYVNLSALPGTTARASLAGLPFDPRKPGAIDLRGTRIDLTAEVGAIDGTVKLAGPTDAAQPLHFAPLRISVKADDVGKGAALTAATTIDVNGKPGGVLDANLGVTGVLDGNGAPVKGLPSGINGTVALRGLATALAQPFAQAARLDLPTDIGPTLDLTLTAAASPQRGAGGTPPVDLDMTGKAANLDLTASLRLADSVLTTREGGVVLRLPKAGAIASRFVTPETGYRMSGTGDVSVSVSDLRVPTRGRVNPGQVSAKVAVVVRDTWIAALNPDGSRGPAVNVWSSNVGATLAPGKPARVDVRQNLGFGEVTDISVVGGFDLHNLFDESGKIVPERVRPIGTLEMKNLPGAVAGVFLKAKPGEPDLAALVREALGPSLQVKLAAAKPVDGADGTALALDVASATMTATSRARLGADKLAVWGTSVNTTLTPGLLDSVLRAFVPDQAGKLMLAAPSQAELTVDPIEIPIKPGMAPDLAGVGDAELKLVLPGRTLVRGLARAGAKGQPARALPPVGVEGVSLAARAPVASLIPPSAGQKASTGQASFTLSGRVVTGESAQDSVIGTLQASAKASVAGGKPAGPVEATVALTNVSPGALDRFLGEDGTLAGLLGGNAQANLAVSMTPPPGSSDVGQGVMEATASVESPRVKTVQPLKARIEGARILLTSPARLTATLDPAFAGRFLQPKPKPGEQPKPATLVFTAPVEVAVDITKLQLSRTTDSSKPIGLFYPGIFETEMAVTVPTVAAATAEGLPLRLSGVKLGVSGGGQQRPAGIATKLIVEQSAVGDQAGATGMVLDVQVARIWGADGQPNMQTARALAVGKLPAIPVALLDALAGQKGRLVEALGPTASVELNARDLSLGAKPPTGLLDLIAVSPRARARVKGAVGEGVFVADGPVDASIFELTKAFSQSFVGGMPVLGAVEKTMQEAPATVVASGLRVPLDNDMTKLNGQVVINPGQLRFETSGFFNQALKTINWRDQGLLGRRLQPLTVDIKDGMASYARYSLPIGEFSVETEGRVDLVSRTIDVVTYIPFGAMTDEAAGKLNIGLGSKLGGILPTIERVSFVPFRTTGGFDAPKTEIDLELFAKNVVGTLRPDELIKRRLDDLLKKP